MGAKAPALTGRQLIRLLEKDGWVVARQARHGLAMTKTFEDRIRVTIVPNTRASLDKGTLAAILGIKQTCIGKDGLRALIGKHGL